MKVIVMIRERARGEYKLDDQIKLDSIDAANKLEVVDEQRANEILAEKFMNGQDSIDIESSDDYKFAMNLQQQFKDLLE